MGTFIGIDLGTTYSVAAFINKNGKGECIPNDYGKNITPSVVDLESTPPLVGFAAKEQQEYREDGLFSFFKRGMGDPNMIYLHKGNKYTPVDLSAIVLRYIKNYAEAFLKQSVTDAVVTVPAYFNNMQRQDTIRAGQQAGLNVLRIISEPTAAALAYGIRPTSSTSRVLVYDLGGGTFDVSLVQISPTELNVIATAGDHYLGGKDWDDRILQYLSSQFETHFGKELIGDDFNALLVQAEKAKIALSTRASTKVTVQSGGITETYELSRTEFENLTQDLMARTKLLVEQVLKDANLQWADLAGALLVGGSTRMPMVREYVERMSGKPVMTGVNEDEAVALGAAIQAAMDIEAQNGQVTLAIGGRKKSTDIISNSLGLIAENEDRSKYVNSVIIQKNQPIPCQETRPYQLRISRRQENKLEVFMTQGETLDPQTCAYLGKYVFTNIPQLSAKVAVIDITYAYNINGVVEVSAFERSTKQPLTLTVEPLPSDVPARFLQPPTSYVEKQREHLTVYMAFDLSGSMSGEPLVGAQHAAEEFLRQSDLTGTSLGIIEFSDSTMTTVRATQNGREIGRGIKGLTIGRTGGGNATDPFDEIYKHLHRASGLRYSLVLTDGMWEDQEIAIERARRCHAAEIQVIAVGFGGADEQFLRQISSSADLSFFTSLSDLSDTFSTIAQELTEGGGEIDLNSIKRRKIKSR